MLPLNPRAQTVFLLVSALIHQAHLLDFKPATEKEIVQSIEGVKAHQKIKNIKKVKSILKIDDDLAQNMKDEINGVKGEEADNEEENTTIALEKKSGPAKVMVDSSVIDQVERLKKMFHVDSLDQIESASLVSSTEAEALDDDDGDDDYKDHDGVWQDETLGRVNKDIRSIESKLSILLSKLKTEKNRAEEHQKVVDTLRKMLTENMHKINQMKETFHEYKAKLQGDDNDIRQLETMIKDLELSKIKDLEMLEQFADNQKSRALFSISKKESLSQSDRDSDYLEKELESLSENSLFSSEEISSNNINEIDTNAHNIFPLKKIISMKKIKSLTKLTEEQAARLKKAQEERNREEGKADEEVADGEEDDEQPVSESQAHGNGNDYSDYIVSGDLKKRPRA